MADPKKTMQDVPSWVQANPQFMQALMDAIRTEQPVSIQTRLPGGDRGSYSYSPGGEVRNVGWMNPEMFAEPPQLGPQPGYQMAPISPPAPARALAGRANPGQSMPAQRVAAAMRPVGTLEDQYRKAALAKLAMMSAGRR